MRILHLLRKKIEISINLIGVTLFFFIEFRIVLRRIDIDIFIEIIFLTV